jgi:hypothetical protein
VGRACRTNGTNRNAYEILVGKPKGKRENQDVSGLIILKWILEREDGMV